MTSIVSGLGLGLFNTSANLLGQSGNALVGRAGQSDSVFINSSTGNLVIQAQDEYLSSLGLDTSLIRTYNSQGLVDGDNNDNWRLNVASLIAPNGAATTVTKRFGDGAEVVYTYSSTVSGKRIYISTAGNGAHDTLTFDSTAANPWTHTDGSSQAVEIYSSDGALRQTRDTDGNITSYGYNVDGLVTVIANGESFSNPPQAVYFHYLGANISHIRVVSNGVTQTLTNYEYDSANRLSKVKVDLTPGDNSIADAKVYTTTYTYDGTSKRVASITQGDTTKISFTYESFGSPLQYRVKTYTETDQNNVARTTTLTYTATSQSLPMQGTATGLTTPTVATAWSGATVREALATATLKPQVVYAPNGDAVAVWASGAVLYFSEYTKANDTWSAPVAHQGTITGTISNLHLSRSSNGNALVTWIQNNNVYARRYVAGVWEAAPTVALDTLAGAAINPVGAINDKGRAVVSFVQTDGTRNNVYVATHNGSAWSAPTAIDDQGLTNIDPIAATMLPDVGIDSLGNATVVWLQKIALTASTNEGIDSLLASRFNVATGIWSDAAALDNSASAITATDVAFDNNGNGVVVYVQAGSLYTSSYTLATGTWSAPARLRNGGVTGNLSLAMNGQGDAVVAFLIADSVYNCRYTGGVWTGAQLLESGAGVCVNPVASINDTGQIGIAFVQADANGVNHLWARRMTAAGWDALAQIETNTASIAAANVPSIAIDGTGNMQVLWAQKQGAQAFDSVFGNRFSLDPYYTVVDGDTWTSIGANVYGDSVATPLRLAMDSIDVPAAGTRMPLPLQLNYAKSAAVTKTDITDALGQTTTYVTDAEGRLRQVLSPTVDNVRAAVSYIYDDSDNVIQVIDAKGNVTTSSYDTNGNLTLQRDAMGNTASFIYNVANQLINETRYLVPDLDGAGVNKAGQSLTARYVYDGQRLRFTVSSAGEVTEHRYAANGNRTSTIRYTGGVYSVGALAATTTLSLAQLNTWIGTQTLTKTERTDYTYDFRGNIDKVSTYDVINSDGTGSVSWITTTKFVYDQRGRLLQTIDPRGTQATNPNNPNLRYSTTFVYDGLGRVLSTTQWIETAEGEITRTVLTVYDDAANKVTTTLANNLATVSVYDKRGLLISVTQSSGATVLGTTTYQYDALGRLRLTTDPLGQKTHRVYDGFGMLVAEIDASGAMVQYVYDKAGNRVQEIAHANRLTAEQLASLTDVNGRPLEVTLDSVTPAASSANRIMRYFYDAANRLALTVTPHDTSTTVGYATQHFYDGAGRLTDTVSYGAVSLGSVTAATSLATMIARITVSADDRHTRSLYDASGKLQGTLDGEGYLTEYQYNGAGKLVHTVRYATAATAHYRAGADFASLKTSVGTNANDQHTYNFYNARGELVITLDAENYMTEFQYDDAGNCIYTGRYAVKAGTYTGVETPSQLFQGTSRFDRLQVREYNGANQVTRVHDYRAQDDGYNTLAADTTSYLYDDLGRLIATERAAGTTEARMTQVRYDAQGRVVQELSGRGSAALAALGANPTQAAVDAVWTQHGFTYTYDKNGKRTSSVDANGNKTLFYYDVNDRLVHTVNALGEVTTTEYSVFGEVATTTRYSGRISLSGLIGGTVTSTLTARIDAIADAAKDNRTSANYTLRGAVKSALDALGFTTSYTYNAFGEIITRSDPQSISVNTLSSFDYDHRGLLRQTIEDTASGGIARTTKQVYDAFGRLVEFTDGNGNLHKKTYDKLGRVLSVSDPVGTSKTTYDAHGRVLTTTDALNQVTTYTYDDYARTFTVKTPEGVAMTTTTDAHGQTALISDGEGNIIAYYYDKNGNLTEANQAGIDGNYLPESKFYDNGNRLVRSVDKNGVSTVYTYDKANRTLTRTLDPKTILTDNDNPKGLALQTVYTYDGQGRTLTVKDPNGIVTETTYNAKGEIEQIAVNPTGLNLRTGFTYDAQGRGVTVTEGLGTTAESVTKHTYDKLGRRITTQVDPTGLNLTTSYAYDKNDNVVSATDARNNVTRFYYDAADRQIYVLSALNELAETVYDAKGRVTKRIGYAVSLTGDTFPLVPTAADIATRKTAIDDTARDNVTHYLYDGDDRLVYTVRALGTSGEVSGTTYDTLGRVNTTERYAARITIPGTINEDTIRAAVATVVDATRDERVTNVYNGVGRVIFQFNNLGELTEYFYDNNGNVAFTWRYAGHIPASTAATFDAVTNAIEDMGYTLASETHHFYDAAGRLVYTQNGLGEVTKTDYDGNGNVVKHTRFATPIARVGTLNPADVAARLKTDVTADQSVRNVYDAANRLKYSVNSVGEVSTYEYDERSNVVKTTRHATRIVPAYYLVTTATWEATALALYGSSSLANELAASAGMPGTLAVGTKLNVTVLPAILVDSNGVIKGSLNTLVLTEQMPIPAANANDIVTRAVFDKADRMIYGVNVLGAEGEVTKFFYDANGNTVRATSYAGRITLPGTLDAASVQTAIDAIDDVKVDRTMYRAYDAANRLAYTVNGLGEVTKNEYDALGNVVKSTRYTTRLSSIPATPTVANIAPTTNAADQIDNLVYDQASRLIYRFNALGEVTQFTYDGQGRVIKSAHYGVRIAPATVATAAAVKTALGNNAPVQFENNVYDAAGQLKYSVNTLGEVTQFKYDTNGNVVKTARFDARIDPATAATQAAIEAALALDPTNLGAELEYRIYDRANRLAFALNALGEVTQYHYNGVGSMIRVDRYATRVPGISPTLDTIAGAIESGDLNGRSSIVTVYDAAGRATHTIDATGGVTRTMYDALGNATSVTAYGTPVDVTLDPAAAIASIVTSSATDRVVKSVYDAQGRLVYRMNSLGEVTKNTYDGIGQVVDSVRYANRIAFSANPNTVTENTADQRERRVFDSAGRVTHTLNAEGEVTKFTYDAHDNVVKTVHYATRIDAATTATATAIDDALAAAAVANPALVPQHQSITSVFDSANRLIYTMNALGEVTKNDYDSRGNVVKTTQYANRVAAGAQPSSVTLNAALDQVLARVVDGANRVTHTLNALGEVDKYTYDSHGNLIGSTRFANRIAPATAATAAAIDAAIVGNAALDQRVVSAYDSAGRLTYRLSSLGEVTKHEYDSRGNLVKTTGYANRIASAYYRVPVAPNGGTRTWANIAIELYGNATVETALKTALGLSTVPAVGAELAFNKLPAAITVAGVTYQLNTKRLIDVDASRIVASITTNGAKDQSLTQVFDANDRVTYRVNASGEVTGYRYNATGDVIVRTDHAARLPAGTAFTREGIEAALTLSIRDRRLVQTFDTAGRLVYSVNALGEVTKNDYDAFGNVVKFTHYANRIAPTYYQVPANPNGGARTWANIAIELYGNAAVETALKTALGLSTVPAEGTKWDVTLLPTSLVVNGTTYSLSGKKLTANITAAEISGEIVASSTKDQITHTVYNGANRAVYRVDALKYATAIVHDTAGNAIRQTQYGTPITLPGTVTEDSIAAAIAAIPVADAGKHRTVRTIYNAINQAVYAIDALGYITENRFDGAGNLTDTIRYSKLPTAAYALDPTVAQVKAVVLLDAAKDQKTSFVSNAAGRVTRTTVQTTSSTTTQIHTDQTFDAFGNVLTVTEAATATEARTTSFIYDSSNRLTDVTDALGTVIRSTYDAFGNVTKRQDAYGTTDERVFSFSYDKANRLLMETTPIVGNTLFSYDSFGNMLVRVVGYGASDARREDYSYDAANRMISSRNAAGEITKYEYDGFGNQTAVTNANYAPLTASDHAGVVGTDSEVTNYYVNARKRLGIYYRSGDVGAIPGNLGQGKLAAHLTEADIATLRARTTVSYEYDRNNRISKATDANGVSTSYEYDSVGNKTKTIQAVGLAGQTRTTIYEYDGNNRLTKITDPLTFVTSYKYDHVGNQVEATDANGNIAVSTYDAAGQLLTYTAGGIKTTNTYDKRGNILTTTQAFTDNTGARVTKYDYDLLNRNTGVTDGEGFTTSIEYDKFGNQTKITAGRYLLVSGQAGYDAAKAQRAANLVTHFKYDALNRLDTMTDGLGNVTDYAHNKFGDRTRMTEASNGLVDTAPRSTVYIYDKAGRVTQVQTPVGGITLYTYDKLGNKIQERVLQTSSSYIVPPNSTWVSVVQTLFPSIPAGDVPEAAEALAAQYGFAVHINPPADMVLNDPAAVLTYQAPRTVTVDAYYVTPAGADGWDDVAVDLYNASGATDIAYVTSELNRLAKVDFPGASKEIAGDDLPGVITRPAESYVATSEGSSWGSLFDQLYSAPGYGPGTDAYKDARADFIARKGSQTVPKPKANASHFQPVKVWVWVENELGQEEEVQVTFTASGFTTIPSKSWSRDPLNTTREEMTTLTGTISIPQTWIINTFEYDSNRNLTASIDSYDTRNEITYDAMGNVKTRKTAAGTADERSVSFDYDLNNRKLRDIDGYGKVTAYEYDNLGNRVKATDTIGNSAYYYYNSANKLTTLLDPTGYVAKFKYDAAGNRLEEYVYMNQYTTVASTTVVPTVTATTKDRITTFTYNLANQMTSRRDPDGLTNAVANGTLTNFLYDGAGKLIKETLYAQLPVAQQRTRGYLYDAAGRLDTFTDVDGVTTKFTYDAANNRLTETITSTTDINRVRITTYTYDLNNRRITEIFTSTNASNVTATLVDKSIKYDLVGNVVREETAASQGRVGTSYSYDKNNRVTREFDDGDRDDRYGYDLAGNRTKKTDGRNYVTDYEFDLNNRLRKEINPTIGLYTIADGDHNARPTVETIYDAGGNAVQTIDANGFKTTRYFDGNGRLKAEIKGDNALCVYKYDAVGNLIQKIEYLQPLTASAHNPLVVPNVAPGANDRVTNYEYDMAGRLTKVTLPPVTVTTLNTSTTPPVATATPATVLTELYQYDAYGQQVKMTDRAGKSAFSYYDVNGNKIATIDALGHRIDWEYDQQGNQTVQRVYAAPVAIPATPGGAPATMPVDAVAYVTERFYDGASRLVKEVAPEIDIFNPTTKVVSKIRPTTTYTYDGAGNRLSRTTGAGTSQATTEYWFYDAGNRLTWHVDANRTLSQFAYNAAGMSVRVRYFGSVDPSIALTPAMTFDVDTDLTGRPEDAAQTLDQVARFKYDGMNRLIWQSEDMGTAPNLVKTFKYDGNGNRTELTDEDGYLSQSAYDYAAHVLQSIAPHKSNVAAVNQVHSFFEYDAFGNMTLAYTGRTGITVLPPTGIRATLEDAAMTISWTAAGLSSGDNVQSYVVYDTDSSTNIVDLSGYRNRTAPVVGSGAASASLGAPAAGTTYYYRVVTQDAAGNRTWSAEQSIVMPKLPSNISVARTGANGVNLTVTVSLDSPNDVPTLKYGAAGVTASSLTFSRVGTSNIFTAEILNYNAGTHPAYKIQWTQGLVTYASGEARFAPANDPIAITTSFTTNTISGSPSGYTIGLSSVFDTNAALAHGFTMAEVHYRPLGSTEGYEVGSMTIGTPGASVTTATATLGSNSAPLAAGSYELLFVSRRADGTSVIVGSHVWNMPTDTSATIQSVSWIDPPESAGSDQLLIINGKPAAVSELDGRVVATVSPALSGATSQSYAGFYGTRLGSTHTANATSSATSGASTVKVSATFAAAEVANGLGANMSTLKLAWRAAGTNATFTNEVAATLVSGRTYAGQFNASSAGSYDVKLYYTDLQGREVIVEWQRITTTTATTTFATNRSLTVKARDTGTIARVVSGVVTATRSTYTGDVDMSPLLSAVDLKPATTDAQTGSFENGKLTTGYYTEFRYDALNQKIASNENDGLWREYGLNKMGAVVHTKLFQTTANGQKAVNATFHSTFAEVDARGRVLTQYDAPTAMLGGATRYSVTKYTYDALDRVKTKRTPDTIADWVYEYNAMGTLVKETNPLGEVGQTLIDQFGQVTGKITARQAGVTPDVAYDVMTRYFYDKAGNLIKEIDAVGNVTTYQYDFFNRKIAETDPRGYLLLNSNAAEYLAYRKGLGVIYRAGDTGATSGNLGTPKAFGHLSPADITFLSQAFTTRFEYDQRDRLTKTIHAQGWHLANDDGDIYQDERMRLGYIVPIGSFPFFRSLAGDLSASQKDELIERYTTSHGYDGRNNRTQTTESIGETLRTTTHAYDGLKRVTDVTSTIDGRTATIHTDYDVFGNPIATINAANDTASTAYGSFGRVSSTTDEDGNVVLFEYDLYGHVTREYNREGTKDVRKAYHATTGQLLTVNDVKTGVSSIFAYNAAGLRSMESVTTPNNLHNRSVSYSYDALGRMTGWSESAAKWDLSPNTPAFGAHMNYLYDADGNRVEAYTNKGWDPHARANGDANFREVHHVYEFDNANRLIKVFNKKSDGTAGTTIGEYTYDAAGNRKTFKEYKPDGTLVATWTYNFDANNRVAEARATVGGKPQKQAWNYDARGNVVSQLTYVDSVLTEKTETTYNEANLALETRTYKRVENELALDEKTVTTYDINGRATTMRMEDWHSFVTGGSPGNPPTVTTSLLKSYQYTYSNYKDGREKSVSITGKTHGNTTIEYDGNKQRIKVNRGKGSGMTSEDITTLVNDNEGHILYRSHSDGVDDPDIDPEYIDAREYLYADGKPVGEFGHNNKKQLQLVVDSGEYNLVQNIDEKHPGANARHLVRTGDTLQSIASLYYGNPSLWFILADANGLDGTTPLKEGTSLNIPNTVHSGRITHENHALYNDSGIVGSTLPRLVLPAPKQNTCEMIAMIVIIVVIAIAASVATAGVGGAIVGAAFGAAAASSAGAVAASVAIYAAVGAVIGAAASVLKQGIFIGMNWQEKWSWSEFAGDTISGSLSGAAAGVGHVAKVAAAAGKLSNAMSSVAKVSAAALKASGGAMAQFFADGDDEGDVYDGKITSWTGIVGAALGGYAEAAGAINQGAQIAYDTAANSDVNVIPASIKSAAQAAKQTADLMGTIGTVSRYVTPWVQVAESYVRNKGTIKPVDWINATAGTVGGAIAHRTGVSSTGNNLGDRLASAGLGLGTNLIIAGVAGAAGADGEMRREFLAKSIGQEIGQFIGGFIEDLPGFIAQEQSRMAEERAKRETEIMVSEFEAKAKEGLDAYDADLLERVRHGDDMYAAGGGSIDLGPQMEDDNRRERIGREFLEGRAKASQAAGYNAWRDYHGISAPELEIQSPAEIEATVERRAAERRAAAQARAEAKARRDWAATEHMMAEMGISGAAFTNAGNLHNMPVQWAPMSWDGDGLSNQLADYPVLRANLASNGLGDGFTRSEMANIQMVQNRHAAATAALAGAPSMFDDNGQLKPLGFGLSTFRQEYDPWYDSRHEELSARNVFMRLKGNLEGSVNTVGRFVTDWDYAESVLAPAAGKFWHTPGQFAKDMLIGTLDGMEQTFVKAVEGTWQDRVDVAPTVLSSFLGAGMFARGVVSGALGASVNSAIDATKALAKHYLSPFDASGHLKPLARDIALALASPVTGAGGIGGGGFRSGTRRAVFGPEGPGKPTPWVKDPWENSAPGELFSHVEEGSPVVGPLKLGNLSYALGHGGYKVVYPATGRDGKLYAVGVMQHNVDPKEAVVAMLHELYALKKLDHMGGFHPIKTHGVTLIGHRPGIVYDYVPNAVNTKDLTEKMDHIPISKMWDEAKTMIADGRFPALYRNAEARNAFVNVHDRLGQERAGIYDPQFLIPEIDGKYGSPVLSDPLGVATGPLGIRIGDQNRRMLSVFIDGIDGSFSPGGGGSIPGSGPRIMNDMYADPDWAHNMNASGGLAIPGLENPIARMERRLGLDAASISGPGGGGGGGGGRYIPRVDVADKYKISYEKASWFQKALGRGDRVRLDYKVADDHYNHAYVENGVLNYSIRSELLHKKRYYGGGKDMFYGMMERFRNEGIEIKAIRDVWHPSSPQLKSDNYDQYLAGLARDLTPDQAALETFTGRMAKDFGFSKATIRWEAPMGGRTPDVIAMFRP